MVLEHFTLLFNFIKSFREINQLSRSDNNGNSAISWLDFIDSNNPIFTGKCFFISFEFKSFQLRQNQHNSLEDFNKVPQFQSVQ